MAVVTKRISGTAMDEKTASNYANLVMIYLEVQVYEVSKSKCGLNVYKYPQENWKRYLDDCMIL